MKCADCKFWRLYTHVEAAADAVGFCRRYAPRPDLNELSGYEAKPDINVRWPQTWGDDFCGDFYVKNDRAF